MGRRPDSRCARSSQPHDHTWFFQLKDWFIQPSGIITRMTASRTYNDSCAIARALDAVGERWALLVVRELLLGPKRFKDLSRSLPGKSQNVLSQRLRELEAA